MRFYAFSPAIRRGTTALGATPRHLPNQFFKNGCEIKLYHCAGEECGFLMEVGYDENQDKLTELRSLVASGPLKE